MKKFFEKTQCKDCQKIFDNKLNECPKCKTKNENANLLDNEKQMLWVDAIRQILLFFLTWIGLTVFSLLTQVITISAMIMQNPNLDVDSLATNVDVIMIPNVVAYIVMTIIIGIVMLPFRHKLLQQFNKLKPYFYGLGFTGLLICASIVWGIISNYIYIAITGDMPTSGNINQITLEKIISVYPVISIIIFGIVGPVVEEFGYRVGLFNFLRRKNRIFAYIVSAIIFGLIHFTIPSTANGWVNELLQIPNYIIAGALLCFAYEKYGLSASITAHVLNNVISIIMVMVGI